MWVLFTIGCQYLEEQRTSPTEVVWSGYVLGDISQQKTVLLQDGAVTFVDMQDGELAEAEQSESTAGYWSATLPVATEVAIRIEGPDHITSVWRGTSPNGRAIWTSLFTQTTTAFDELTAALAEFPTVTAPDWQADVVHLWGQPLNPDALTGATMTLFGGDGNTVNVHLFALDDDGAVRLADNEPASFFYATGAAPGDVILEVVTQDGTITEAAFPARAGDVVTPMYFDVNTP